MIYKLFLEELSETIEVEEDEKDSIEDDSDEDQKLKKKSKKSCNDKTSKMKYKGLRRHSTIWSRNWNEVEEFKVCFESIQIFTHGPKCWEFIKNIRW